MLRRPKFDDVTSCLHFEKIQIKSSFKNYSYFPYGKDKLPDYFLSLNVHENGDLEELFNGPGQFIVEHYIKARKLKPFVEMP